MNDFADWLSPIIVKELRQGMRAKLFVVIFIILQMACFVTLLTALSGDSNAKEVAGVFFWIGVGAALCVAMPLRGLTALLGEIKGNTLELLLLTRLSAWRILVGKWLALILQTFLMVCTLLPYVMLRYFLGGVDLAQDWQILGWLLLASVGMTTISVSFSPYLKTLAGKLALAGFGVLTLIGFIFITDGFFSRNIFSGSGSNGVIHLLAILLLLVPMGIFGLWEIGVSAFAPAAENHALRKRLLVLGSLLVGICFPGESSPVLVIFPLVFLGAVWFSSLLEETVELPSLYKPFARRGTLGMVIGRFFYPGWNGGLLFALLACALWLCVLPIVAWQNNSNEIAFAIFATLETALVPLALVLLFPTFRKKLLLSYGGALLVFLAISIPSATLMDSGLEPRAIIPVLNLMSMSSSDSPKTLWPLTAVVVIVTLIALWALAHRERRTIRQMEREAVLLP